ncbi:MAG: hydrogenase maturation protease [Archaeoglobi archaeon]|nr:hydrogenase maturation protease [Candidatus Mnemosynella sp.]MBC7114832.1 hydrogenase maturation protease [Candidatus Mnemosynella bozhongmuii]
MPKPILIIGCGNPLMGDDGAGNRVVEKLREFQLPEYVEIEDVGVGGLGIIELLLDRKKIIVVDAVRTGAPPGTLHVLRRDELPSANFFMISPHDIGLLETLELAEKVFPERVTKNILVIGIEAGVVTEYTDIVSEEVRRAIDEAVQIVLQELGIT